MGAESFSFWRLDDRIAQEAEFAGLYVIRTSTTSDALCTEETVTADKSLPHVERAFRSLKTMALQARPIHHGKDDRVKSLVFLCIRALYVAWHLRRDRKNCYWMATSARLRK